MRATPNTLLHKNRFFTTLFTNTAVTLDTPRNSIRGTTLLGSKQAVAAVGRPELHTVVPSKVLVVCSKVFDVALHLRA